MACRNAGLLSIGPLQSQFSQNAKLFIHKDVSENIVCEMAAIFLGRDDLSAMKPQWV